MAHEQVHGVSGNSSDAEPAPFEDEVPADIDHQYTEPGKGSDATRAFTILNNPEPDEDGVMRYTLYEVKVVDGKHVNEVVERDLTTEEVEKFITENGAWSA